MQKTVLVTYLILSSLLLLSLHFYLHVNHKKHNVVLSLGIIRIVDIDLDKEVNLGLYDFMLADFYVYT